MLEAYGNENKDITILRGGEIQSISYADILTYINELEKCSKKWQKICADEVTLNKTLKDRIAELEYGIAKSMLGCEFLPECTNEKLKQFAERLKEESAFYRNGERITDMVTFDTIDETLKEFLKGENNE